MKTQINNTRRHFIKGGLLALSSIAVRPALAAFQQPITETGTRELTFHNLHTGENLQTEYWSKGEYIPDALTEINHILRDFRTDQILPIDPQLIDLLHQLQATLGSTKPFQIISGYRSPTTNANLAAHSGGVAKGSLHMQGKAIDLRIEGIQLHDLRQAAITLQGGGVGYYPLSNFVHVDVGRIRSWG